MTVSDFVQNVAYRDPHSDVTDVLTYMADKGAETRTQGWPISWALGSLAVREEKEQSGSMEL